MTTPAREWPIIVGGVPPFADHPDRACAGVPVGMFYPKRGDNAPEVKRLCRGCPLVAQCLQWAVDNFETGIWGGTSPDEREAIRGRGDTASPRISRRVALLRGEAVELRSAGLEVRAIARRLGLDHRTVGRYLADAESEAA